MALTADEVLARLAASPVVMGLLDSGACEIEHVSVRDANGPDVRTDDCPCERVWADGERDALSVEAQKIHELGGGRYVSSPRHTLGDLVRDVTTG